MKVSKLFKSLVATSVVIVLGGPAVVLAGAPSYFETNTVTVSYADLNLESEEGTRVLYQRLQHASKEVCGLMSGNVESILAVKGIWRCARKSLSNAVEKTDNDDLTRIHAG